MLGSVKRGALISRGPYRSRLIDFVAFALGWGRMNTSVYIMIDRLSPQSFDESRDLCRADACLLCIFWKQRRSWHDTIFLEIQASVTRLGSRDLRNMAFSRRVVASGIALIRVLGYQVVDVTCS